MKLFTVMRIVLIIVLLFQLFTSPLRINGVISYTMYCDWSDFEHCSKCVPYIIPEDICVIFTLHRLPNFKLFKQAEISHTLSYI